MDEELQTKMDTYNEMLLKNTALTFSSEGVSNDVKIFLSRKATFVADMLNGLASLIEAASSGKVSSTRAKLFDDMIEHALIEVRTVNSTMNYVIAKTFEKESSFVPPEQRAEENAPTKKVRSTRRKK